MEISKIQLDNIAMQECHELMKGVVCLEEEEYPLKCINVKYLEQNDLKVAMFYDIPFSNETWSKIMNLYVDRGRTFVTINLDTYFYNGPGIQNENDLILGSYRFRSGKLDQIREQFVYSDRVTVSEDKKLILVNHFSDFVLLFANQKEHERLFGDIRYGVKKHLLDKLECEDIPLHDQTWVKAVISHYDTIAI